MALAASASSDMRAWNQLATCFMCLCQLPMFSSLTSRRTFAPQRQFPPISAPVELPDSNIFLPSAPRTACCPRWLRYSMLITFLWASLAFSSFIANFDDYSASSFQHKVNLNGRSRREILETSKTRFSEISNYTFHHQQVVLQGQVDKFGEPHGFVTILYADGSKLDAVQFKHGVQVEGRAYFSPSQKRGRTAFTHLNGKFSSDGTFDGECSLFGINNSTGTWYGNCLNGSRHGFGVETNNDNIIVRAGIWSHNHFQGSTIVPTHLIDPFQLPGKAFTYKASLLRIIAPNDTGPASEFEPGKFVYYVGSMNSNSEPNGLGDWYSSPEDIAFQGGTYAAGKLVSGFRVTRLLEVRPYQNSRYRFQGDFDEDEMPHGIVEVQHLLPYILNREGVMRMGMRHGQPCGLMYVFDRSESEYSHCYWNSCRDTTSTYYETQVCNNPIFSSVIIINTWYSIYQQPWWKYLFWSSLLAHCSLLCCWSGYRNSKQCDQCPGVRRNKDRLCNLSICWKMYCCQRIPQCVAGELVSGNSRWVRLTDHNLLYRTLNDTDERQWKIEGISAKDPTATRSVLEHVADGSKPGYRDQYISTTSDLEVARRFAGIFGALVVIRRPTLHLIDLTTEAIRRATLANSPELGARHRRALIFAARSSEVLVNSNSPNHRISYEDIAQLSPLLLNELNWRQQDVDPSRCWPSLELLETISSEHLSVWKRVGFQLPSETLLMQWKVQNRYVRRFHHVSHSDSHYLSFCGQPNLNWRNSQPRELASPEQLVAQCQTEVIATLLYPMLLGSSARDRDNGLTIPPATLHLCRVAHVVPHETDDGRGLDGVFFQPRLVTPTPLLMYEYNELLKPWPSSGLDLHLSHHGTVHLRASFRASLVVDALLANTQIASDIFVTETGSGHRYGHHFILGNRSDEEIECPSVWKLLLNIVEVNPLLFENENDLKVEVLRQVKHVLAACGDFFQDHQILRNSSADKESESPNSPPARNLCRMSEVLLALDKSRQVIGCVPGSIQAMFTRRLRDLEKVLDWSESENSIGLSLQEIIKHAVPSQGAHNMQTRRRIAVCISIDSYLNQPALEAAAIDCDVMSAALRSSGFETQVFRNIGKGDFEILWDEEVLQQLQPNDLLVVYFSGHGVSYHSEQYLLAKDYHRQPWETPKEAGGISVQILIDSLHARQLKLALDQNLNQDSNHSIFAVFLLDCCSVESQVIRRPSISPLSEDSKESGEDLDTDLRISVSESSPDMPSLFFGSHTAKSFEQSYSSHRPAHTSTHRPNCAQIYVAAASLPGREAYAPATTGATPVTLKRRCSYFTQAVLTALGESEKPLHEMIIHANTILSKIQPASVQTAQRMWITQTPAEESLSIYLGDSSR